MNKIFKVIWNHTTQRFDVVSELTRSKGKSSSQTDKRVGLNNVVLAIGLSVVGVTIGNEAQAAVTTASQLVNSFCAKLESSTQFSCSDEQHIYQTGTKGQTKFVAYADGSKAALGVDGSS